MFGSSVERLNKVVSALRALIATQFTGTVTITFHFNQGGITKTVGQTVKSLDVN